jgi:hypothetical protein
MAVKRPRKTPARKKRPVRPVASAKRVIAQPVSLSALGDDFTRIDLEVDGIDHSGASMKVLVFLDNPRADTQTPRVAEYGYAGEFNIFGHGGCYGDVGHCDVTHRRPYDPRPGHPLTPIRKVVTVTDSVKRLLAQQKTDVEVRIVPIVTGVTERCNAEDTLKFTSLRLVSYL